ncbi:FtsX-like permease family protein [Devosia sp. J2-20]|uniref:ABC transporter permease n=1 Tax=Devosia sp. J2-20 TaxID=3026161 RepID=UPI00249AA3E6|nr:FtsX-like permease family protein [Devosia sp. J2-20]WDR00774.1 FtsX-like permease family protein [Devosia sp. J2-20]
MNRLIAWLRVALIDLRGSAARFTILIACLALGVAAIGVVSSVRSAVETAIARDARAILGGDLELRSQRTDITPDVLSALEKLGPVNREVQLNSQAQKGYLSAFLSLRGVGDLYPLVGDVVLAPGALPGSTADLLGQQNGVWGILLSPQAALRLEAAPGDTIRVGTLELQLRGIIDTLPDQATLGFQLGAPALVSDATLPLAGLKQEGVLNQFQYKVLLEDTDFASAETALEEQFPDSEVRIRSPREATASIARFITIFGNFMLLVALSSMVVGGLGAANAVTAYVGERQSAIATMRSLGASGNRIMVQFLAQIIFLSLLSIAIGLVAIAVGTFAILPLLAGLIGLDLPAALDLRSMAAAGGIGLVTAIIFAWLPLLHARAIRPALLFRAGGSSNLERQDWRSWLTPIASVPLLIGFALLFALTLSIASDMQLVAIYFAGTVVAFLLLRLAAALLGLILSRVPPPPNRLLRMALSAIVRPGAPTTTVLVSMGMGLSLLLLIVTTQSNINNQIATEVTTEAPAFVLLDLDKPNLAALTDFVAATPDIEALTTIPMLRGTITALKGAPPPTSEDDISRDVADMFRGDTALTWSAAMPADTVIAEGEWWTEDYSGDPQVSLSTEMRDALDLSIGDSIEIAVAGRPLAMTIASFRLIDWRSPNFNFRIIVSPGLIESAPQSYFGTITVAEGADGVVEAALLGDFPQLNFVPVGDTLARVRAVFDGLINAIALVSGTAVLAGILVLAGALSVGRQQRQADAVVMKVLGAKRSDVIAAFLIEYALLGAIAAVLASGIAMLGAWAAATWLLEIDFMVPVGQLGLVALLVIVVTIVTGAATTWSAMSTTPAAKLRMETP